MYAYLPNLYASVYVWVGVWVVSVFHSSRVFFLGPISECFFVCFRRGKSSSSSVLNQIREMGVQKKRGRCVGWALWNVAIDTSTMPPHLKSPTSEYLLRLAIASIARTNLWLSSPKVATRLLLGIPFVSWVDWCGVRVWWTGAKSPVAAKWLQIVGSQV